MVEISRSSRALEEPVERGERRDGQRVAAAPAPRPVAAELLRGAPQVLELLRALLELQERDLLELVVRDRKAEAVAEAADGVDRDLLLLVGDVHRLARLAHAVALDGLREDHRRLALVLRGRVVRGVDLERIVPAAVEPPDALVRQLRDELAAGDVSKKCSRTKAPSRDL